MLYLAACGGGESGGGDAPDAGNGGGGDGPDAAAGPQGEHYTYAVSDIDIPESSQDAVEIGLDLDGDGEADNGLGFLLGGLGPLLDGLDLQATLTEQFETGEIILLADVQASSLDSAQNAAMWVYLGANPSNAPCDSADPPNCGLHLDGATEFELDPTSPTNARIDGTITSGAFSGGPGDVSLSLQILEGSDDPIELNLKGARAEITSVTETGLMSGRLAGGVTIQNLESELLPAIAEGLTAYIAEECAGSGMDPTPCGCPADSTGETLQTTFDSDDSCDVTGEELKDSDEIATFLMPDVDLLDEDGNYNPGSDGVPESMSLGIGFTAVGAVYTSPNE